MADAYAHATDAGFCVSLDEVSHVESIYIRTDFSDHQMKKFTYGSLLCKDDLIYQIVFGHQALY